MAGPGDIFWAVVFNAGGVSGPSDSDSGSATELVSFAITDDDPASGDDTAPAQARLQSTDAGSGADAARVRISFDAAPAPPSLPPGRQSPMAFMSPLVGLPDPGILPSNILDLETGVFTESDPVVTGLGDTDFTSGDESVHPAFDVDSCTVDDSLAAIGLPPDADSGSGADTQRLAPTDGDTGSAGSFHLISFRDPDTITATEDDTTPIGTPLSDSDAFAASVDAQLPPGAARGSSDTGHATEAATPPPAQISDSDTGALDDESSQVFGADSATAAEGDPVTAVTGADTGHGTDSAGLPGPADADVISSTSGQGFPNRPASTDNITAAEGTPSTVSHLASSDGLTGFFGYRTEDPKLKFGTLEGFSVYRVAILDPGTGLESAQLYGASSATVTPVDGGSALTADDTVLHWWGALDSLDIEVTSGFIPFGALATLYGTATHSSGAAPRDYYARPIMTTAMPTTSTVAMVIRMRSRPYAMAIHGEPRTLDLVLYKVRITALSPFSLAYKTGLVTSFSATAAYSTTDEHGDALPFPRLGRLVGSPGQPGGAITSALFGRGT